MAHYSLEHLTQPEHQAVCGPIQDDEALFLYALIRGMRIKSVLEIGGLNGYSARNFAEAVGPDGMVITCDLNPVNRVAQNHLVIVKDALAIDRAEIPVTPVELIFFDCHDYHAQMGLYNRFIELGLIDEKTVIALHDTNTHGFQTTPTSYLTDQGFVHQPVERRMVNDFVGMGFHAFCVHTRMSKHSASFPFRHGITIVQKFRELTI